MARWRTYHRRRARREAWQWENWRRFNAAYEAIMDFGVAITERLDDLLKSHDPIFYDEAGWEKIRKAYLDKLAELFPFDDPLPRTEFIFNYDKAARSVAIAAQVPLQLFYPYGPAPEEPEE